jgi:hypothetical protein
MKKNIFLLMITATFIFGIKANGLAQTHHAAVSKTDSLLINAALLQLEKLPQGVPAIRYLEAKGLIKKNEHYYSIRIKSETKPDDWLVCSDPGAPELLKNSILPLNVQLSCDVFNLLGIPGNKQPFIIVKKITVR